ncbi:ADP-ribosylglycohydrolase family protein, partial [Salmonella enterica]|nr:ADP-ribosylglycohydrolase family protein [Salmonella enterica]
MIKAFRHWLDYPYYLNFTGPTTRAAMQKLFNDKRMSLQGAVEASSQPSDVILINNGNVAATNGAAMKIWVSVLLTKELSYEEKEEQLLANVYSVCKLTHNNVLSVSGAAAVAFAISTALDENCSFSDIFTAAIDGAEKGYSYAFKRGAIMVAGASVAERIKLAVSIGNSYNDWSEAVKPLADIIGSGLQANEAVPVTFGLLASCRKKPLDAILGGVNIGNDTDTVATMAGAIAGAFSGAMAFDRDDIEKLESANGFSFHKMVAELASIPG